MLELLLDAMKVGGVGEKSLVYLTKKMVIL